MNLYYAPNIESKEIVLPEEEARHCTQVLRLQVNDKLHLTDGQGNLCSAQIDSIRKREVKLSILNKVLQEPDRNFKLHIAIAPTKNIDRFEWFLEKATEIGIDQITPIITEHSERRNIRPDRLEKILVAAMKQSIKFYKPVLNSLCSFIDFINNEAGNNLGIAYCGEAQKQELKNFYQAPQDITLLIGPEGDFSPAEVETAVAGGARVISMGTSRLRTETAGVVACHTINLLNQ